MCSTAAIHLFSLRKEVDCMHVCKHVYVCVFTLMVSNWLQVLGNFTSCAGRKGVSMIF